MRCCLFAHDGGPRQTLAMLANHDGFFWAEASDLPSLSQWLDYFNDVHAEAVVVGTSRSECGLKWESGFRLAARRAGLPVVAIEDYPGNYQDIEEGEAGLLIVESERVATLLRERFGLRCPRVATGASLRYDGRRVPASNQEVGHTGEAPRVLWIGQPETDDALHTLGILLPHLAPLGVELLFRAHPRDQGYFRGCYWRLFGAYKGVVRDVSGFALTAVLEQKPCLSVTQFSSLAIELGFLGIPVLHALYPESGGRRLQALTGYGVPPVCLAGGSDTISVVDETGQKLRQAIFDSEARQATMERFRAYLEVEKLQADGVAAKIRHFFEQRTTHP